MVGCTVHAVVPSIGVLPELVRGLLSCALGPTTQTSIARVLLVVVVVVVLGPSRHLGVVEVGVPERI